MAIAATFAFVESKAQLTNGVIAPDWTLTDINGNVHHLYSDLDSGKTVFIDISATWCGPCWNYHNTGALDQLWSAHGPIGQPGVSPSSSNDVKVYFIEGDGTTNSNDLNGTGSNTQGNWTAGVSHPIIDPPANLINPFNSNYSIAYFPTIYMICPDRTITEVGQATATALYSAKGSCAIATTVADAEVTFPIGLYQFTNTCDSISAKFRLTNVGTDTLTSATLTYKLDNVAQRVVNWTGNIVTYHNVLLPGVNLGSSTPGAHMVTVVVSNPNGITDPTTTNNSASSACIIYATTPVAPIVQDFETAGIPSTWTIVNEGAAPTWVNANVGFSSAKSAKLTWYGSQIGDLDYLYLEPQDFTTAPAVTLTFEVAYAQRTNENDKLSVEVSTNCGHSWSPKYTKSGSTLSTTTAHAGTYTPTTAAEWRLETVNLNAVAGQPEVWVRFKGTSSGGNNVYVDDINIVGVSGVNEINNVSGLNVYPNPMTTSTNVNFNLNEANVVIITVINSLGQVVSTENLGNMTAGEQNYTLNTESLSNGLYFISINAGTGSVTEKISVNK